MVTGGLRYLDTDIDTVHVSKYLDSTEIYDDNDWKTVTGKLPSPMYDLRATTLENRVYIFGISVIDIVDRYYNVGCF